MNGWTLLLLAFTCNKKKYSYHITIDLTIRLNFYLVVGSFYICNTIVPRSKDFPSKSAFFILGGEFTLFCVGSHFPQNDVKAENRIKKLI